MGLIVEAGRKGESWRKSLLKRGPFWLRVVGEGHGAWDSLIQRAADVYQPAATIVNRARAFQEPS